ncbi:hypothetical protein FACS1894105_10390 [Clostridia bacterium]|nr:hypothetical protein FACS1894105_10390 [Clostridia bacterium]GHV12989.1 hypothetical protein FACS1894219_06990 [Clostridia bacterium]
MIKVIVGVQGTGKTKTLITRVNDAADKSSGNVVCIEKGAKLKYDIKHEVKLISASEYGVHGADALYGLVCGLYAANFDITHIFIDSALKLCEKDVDAFAKFLDAAENISAKNGFEIFVTASADPATLPESVLKYVEKV